MALDSNLLDDTAPNADAISALRPKRKRIKPWQDLPAVQNESEKDPGISPRPTDKLKYGQTQGLNRDKTSINYGQGGSNSDIKYGQSKSETTVNSYKAPSKSGQNAPNASTAGPKANSSSQLQMIHRAAPLEQVPNQIRTTTSVSISDGPCPHLDQPLSLNESSSSPANTDKLSIDREVVPNRNLPRPDLQMTTCFTDKYGQQRLPPSPQKLAILQALQADQDATGLGHTRVLSTTWIAQTLGLPVLSVRKQLDRMKAEGRIERLNGRRGRGAAGCIYKVSHAESVALKSNKYGQGSVLNTDNKYGRGEIDGDSSSRSLSIKETTIKKPLRSQLIDAFDELIREIEVNPQFKVDGTDLVDWWFKVEKDHGMNLEEFKLSFERWVFKLSASPIKADVAPKGLLAKRVLSGVCGLPEGFISLQDKRDNALRDMRTNQLKAARQKQLDQYNDEFELWCMEADDAKLLEFVSEADGSRDRVRPDPGKRLSRGPMLKALVKEAYAAFKDIDIVHWEHLAEQLNL